MPKAQYYPSVSSVKTNFSPEDYVNVLQAAKSHHFLVSSYDINENNGLIDKINRLSSDGINVILDSGNYESYWHKDDEWSIKTYNDLLSQLNVHFAFSFDDKNEFKEVSQAVNNIYDLWSSNSEASTNTIVPIVKGPAEVILDIVCGVAQCVGGKSSQSDPLNPVLTDPLYHTCKKVLSISC